MRYIYITLVLALLSCCNNDNSFVINGTIDVIDDTKVYILQADQNNQPFIKDSTGIRIYIDEGVSNARLLYPQNGNHVLLAYHCVVFEDSEVIINNVLEDTIFFKLGYSKQMKGLNHAIKLLKTGDNAKIIIPSYLGFGMSGYKNIVQPYSTLLLNVKLLNIKE